MPPEVVAEFLKLGLAGAVIIVLLWIALRKDQQVDRLQEARVVEANARAADNLHAAEIIEKQNQAAQQREKTADERWRVMELVVEVNRSTAEKVTSSGVEIARIGRRVDAIANRQNIGGGE